MIITFVLQWATLLLVVVAQSSTFVRVATLTEYVSPSKSTKAAQTHAVAVGKGNHQFVPDSIQAEVGDIVEFQFFPPNHSVVRAEYGIPCIPYELTGETKVGFYSGFFPVSRILDNPPTYHLLINDTEPIFFYCSAPGSCITWGMVGAINPNTSQTVAEQQANAKKATYMLNPGEPLPTSEDGSTPSAPTEPSAPAAQGNKLSPGAIAGIAVAGVVTFLLIAAFLILLGRNSNILSGKDKDRTSTVPSHPGYESGMQSPHPSKPMSDYNPYAPLSPYGLPPPQSPPPVELSSPDLEHHKHSSMFSDAATSDDARWQTITPPPHQPQPAIHSELDASPHAHHFMLRDARGAREDHFR